MKTKNILLGLGLVLALGTTAQADWKDGVTEGKTELFVEKTITYIPKVKSIMGQVTVMSCSQLPYEKELHDKAYSLMDDNTIVVCGQNTYYAINKTWYNLLGQKLISPAKKFGIIKKTLDKKVTSYDELTDLSKERYFGNGEDKTKLDGFHVINRGTK